ncbi:MAG: helix-turn-helix domain-containing protein [bacterium]
MHPIGKNIRVLRQMQGVTQTRLAEEVGVAPAYISQIESMIRVPSVKVTHRIAEALGTTVGTLLGENPEASVDGRLTKLEQIHLLKRLLLELEAELQQEEADEPHVAREAAPTHKGFA